MVIVKNWTVCYAELLKRGGQFTISKTTEIFCEIKAKMAIEALPGEMPLAALCPAIQYKLDDARDLEVLGPRWHGDGFFRASGNRKKC